MEVGEAAAQQARRHGSQRVFRRRAPGPGKGDKAGPDGTEDGTEWYILPHPRFSDAETASEVKQELWPGGDASRGGGLRDRLTGRAGAPILDSSCRPGGVS